MRRTLAIIVILLSASSVALSGDYAGYAGAFLRNGIGARALGMGGAFTAVAEGIDAVYYNPAGLGFIPKTMAGFSYKSLSLDRHLGHVAVAFPIRNEAAMAASWLNFGVSDVPMRGQSRQILGEVGNSSDAFELSFGKALSEMFSFGGKLRYIQEKFDDLQSFTVGMDLGAVSKPHKFVSLAAVFQNIGSKHQWNGGEYWSRGTTYEEQFPIVMKFGAAGYFVDDKIISAAEIETSDKGELKFRAGAELWYTRKTVRQVEDEYEEDTYIEIEEDVRVAGLRIGIDRKNPAFGASLIQEIKNISLSLDYAYLVGREGTSAGHLFTLGFVF
ncbi:MAG: PorV/PorQ family protein [Candidatus Zixiibacteriota bacterium]|nr:MAG: PorV/PorQ family protein [candidate division Zixibacteria bacterium]